MELYEVKHPPELPGLFVDLNAYYDNIASLPLFDEFYFFYPDRHFLALYRYCGKSAARLKSI